MMTLDELFGAFAGMTTIQKDRHLQSLIGANIQLKGEIANVDAQHVTLVEPSEYSNGGEFALRLPVHTSLSIAYDEALLPELQGYSSGDAVEMVARLESAHFASSYSAYYTIRLATLRRLSTRAERLARAHADAAAKQAPKPKDSACFVATAAYGVDDAHVAVLREFRDDVLARTRTGRYAIQFYYLLAPPLAHFIEPSHRRRAAARALLGPVVRFARRQLPN